MSEADGKYARFGKDIEVQIICTREQILTGTVT